MRVDIDDEPDTGVIRNRNALLREALEVAGDRLDAAAREALELTLRSIPPPKD